jgi:hypothetical protein
MSLEVWMKSIDDKLSTVIDKQSSTNERVAILENEMKSVKEGLEKQNNRSWDWRKSLSIAFIGGAFVVILGVSINSIISKDVENKKIQLELQKKELELKQKELEEKLKPK